jgi:hypothetical protein
MLATFTVHQEILHKHLPLPAMDDFFLLPTLKGKEKVNPFFLKVKCEKVLLNR